MAETLNEVERRVLGALIEKSLTQSQYYPMTLNALVTACNQKSNRDPLMELDEETVWDVLERLRAVGLVSRILPGAASRVERFRHEVKQTLGWEKPQWAVMAELLLRGPQTVGELRGRCSRMVPFESTDAIATVLNGLGQADPPRVATLPRQPGRSAVRYAHLLYEPDEWARLSEAPEPCVAGGSTPTGAARAAHGSAAGDELDALRSEVEQLRSALDDLRESVAQLRQRMESLESQ